MALEGIYVGTQFSVVEKGPNQSYLDSQLPAYKPAAKLKYIRSTKKLTTPLGEFDSEMDPINPIPIGTHKVQIPDAPHRGGIGYLDSSRMARSWFHIGEGRAVTDVSDRYLHPGRFSAGCVTLTDVEKWDDLYGHLILCRHDELNVGTLEVTH